ncbi:MAG: hypothetical protein JSR37_06735 [Verrucomicrobia bacterium]|nr:hypothetical protein [Verrucomicrobiota bacterium]MBS0636880.1 hypothetical protein [Verrucomicrobiota bacterium]
MKTGLSLWRFLILSALCVTATSYADTLRERLARRLPDIERVDHIVEAYATMKEALYLDETTEKTFEDWLAAKVLFIGSRYYDHNLVYKRLPALQHNEKFTKAYSRFVSNITIDNASEWRTERSETNKKITLLFTGAYGGGHRAPTMAIKQYLEEKGHTVQLIDVDEVENRYSPQIDGYTKADIYAEVYQKQNDPKKAERLTKLLNAAQKIEDQRFLADIKDDIIQFQPDHIIAVAHHKPKLAYLSYSLGVPMTYMHTDHGFNRTLLPILYEQERLSDTPLIHFAMLSRDALFDTSESIVRQLVRVDFPVRPSFQPASSKEKLKLREKLNIPADAVVVKLAMGANGLANDMKRLLNRMKRDSKKIKKPFHVFVVCGKNEQLKKDLEKYGKNKSKLNLHVLGFLDEKAMAEIDRASDVWITKPGGSTSAELVQTQKQMLYEINPAHPWEQNNATFLKSIGLAKKLDKKKSIIKQIEERIKRHKSVVRKQLPLSNWQKQLDEVIEGV